jgi:hypothetical protein
MRVLRSFFRAAFLFSLFACGSPLNGDFRGVDPASRTETLLSLNADGTYTLSFVSADSAPDVLLEGHYTLREPFAASGIVTLDLRHTTLALYRRGGDAVVSRRVNEGALCAAASAQETQVCVSARHVLSAKTNGGNLSIAEPPFAFMAKQLERF